MTTPTPRPIRSFVRRRGRITPAQQRALDTHTATYLLNLEKEPQPLDLTTIFQRPAEKHLEIGFGMGDTLFSMAQAHPQHDYLGIDVYLAGFGYLLNKLGQANLTNVRLLQADAVDILTHALPAQSLDVIYIFFPDPWHKTRHHKRRLIQPDFIKLLATRLRIAGKVHLATDWQAYAEQMLDYFDASPDFSNQAGHGQYAPRFPLRPLTKFEQRGQRLGHGVWDLSYQRITPTLPI